MQHVARSRVMWILMAALSGACAGSGEGLDENGRPVDEAPPPGPGSGDAMFQEIQDTVFTPICTQCHQGGAAPLGLRLDAGNSYATLVGIPSVQVPSLLRVNPGNPGTSYLVQKVEGTAAIGGRMPLGGPALPQDRIDLIKQWIATGAQQVAVIVEAPSLRVTSTIPADGETLVAAPARLVLVFGTAVDAALAAADTIELNLLRDGQETGAGDTAWQVVGISPVTVSLANPTVITVAPDAPLAPGRYRLRVRGDGVPALADVDSRVLDGDGDGLPGGDFLLHFEVATEDSP